MGLKLKLESCRIRSRDIFQLSQAASQNKNALQSNSLLSHLVVSGFQVMGQAVMPGKTYPTPCPFLPSHSRSDSVWLWRHTRAFMPGVLATPQQLLLASSLRLSKTLNILEQVKTTRLFSKTKKTSSFPSILFAVFKSSQHQQFLRQNFGKKVWAAHLSSEKIHQNGLRKASDSITKVLSFTCNPRLRGATHCGSQWLHPIWSGNVVSPVKAWSKEKPTQSGKMYVIGSQRWKLYNLRSNLG